MATNNGHEKGKTVVNRKREQKREDSDVGAHERRGGMKKSKAYQTDGDYVMVPIEHFRTIVGACGEHLWNIAAMNQYHDVRERRQAAKSAEIVFVQMRVWLGKHRPIDSKFKTLLKLGREISNGPLADESRDARQETE